MPLGGRASKGRSYHSKNTGRTSSQPRPPQHKDVHISETGPTTDILNAGTESTFSDCAPFGAGPGSARDNPDVIARVKSWGGPTGSIFGLGGPRGPGDPPNFWGAGLRGQRISAIIRFRGRLSRPPRGWPTMPKRDFMPVCSCPIDFEGDIELYNKSQLH